MTSPQKMVVTRSMAKQPPALVRHTAEEEEVFLGGACGDTTWRRDVAMPVLKDAGVSFYNPQVEEWHEGLVELERRAKKSALVNLFVVSGATRGSNRGGGGAPDLGWEASGSCRGGGPRGSGGGRGHSHGERAERSEPRTEVPPRRGARSGGGRTHQRRHLCQRG